MVDLIAPRRMSSVSVDGQEYKIVKGRVTVPESAVAALVAHGLVPAEDGAEVEAPTP